MNPGGFDDDDMQAYRRGKNFWSESAELEKEHEDFNREKTFKRMWDKGLDGAKAAYEDLKINPEPRTPGEELKENLRRNLGLSDRQPSEMITRDNLGAAIKASLGGHK